MLGQIGARLGRIGAAAMDVVGSMPKSAAVAGTVGGGMLLLDALKPIGRRAVDPLGEEIRRTFQERAWQLSERMKGQRMVRAMRENEARLAALDPDLYAMLSAGQRLPIGGRVFGGTPNRDAINAVTAKMAAGEFRTRTPEQDYLELVR